MRAFEASIACEVYELTFVGYDYPNYVVGLSEKWRLVSSYQVTPTFLHPSIGELL